MEEIVIPAGSLGQLALENFCPRCFWVGNKVNTPFEIGLPGIFSSIDSYIKYVVRTHFEKKGCLPDWFPKNNKIKEIVSKNLHYSWFSTNIFDVTLRGTPDDVFQMKDGGYFIVDYKTARLTDRQEGLIPQFEVQLNCYAYIAEKLGLKPVEYLSLIFLEPQSSDKFISKNDLVSMVKDDSFLLKFIPKEKEVRKDFAMVEKLTKKAKEILMKNEPPDRLKECENCDAIDEFVREVSKFLLSN